LAGTNGSASLPWLGSSAETNSRLPSTAEQKKRRAPLRQSGDYVRHLTAPVNIVARSPAEFQVELTPQAVVGSPVAFFK
jgi:hypothetical protein